VWQIAFGTNRELFCQAFVFGEKRMLDPYWQYEIPLWFVFFIFATVLLVPMEIGSWLGSRQLRLRPDLKTESTTDVTLAAMLTLLGLMLAFTYSFSMGRADLRKKALTTEVNAIGTAFLRADLAAEPGRTTLRKGLLEYARSRLVSPESVRNREELQAVIDKSVAIQSQLWPATKAILQQEGMSAPEKALLVSAINDVLDAHTTRMMVIYDRLPTVVLLLLLLIAGGSLAVAAYKTSLTGQNQRWRMTAFACILAALIYIILDFDMILRGFIRIDYSNLANLIRDMDASMP
jgi:hypothetical protein